MARRGKNRAGFFSCACVRIRLKEFSPSNICLYTIAAALRKQTGQAQRLKSAMGISLPRVNTNVAQIGTDDATWL